MTVRRNWGSIAGLLILLSLLAQEVFIVEGVRYLFVDWKQPDWSALWAFANVYYFIGVALSVAAIIVCFAHLRRTALWLTAAALFMLVTTTLVFTLLDWHLSGDTLANTLVYDIKLYLLGIASDRSGNPIFVPHEVFGDAVAWLLLGLAIAVIAAAGRPVRAAAQPTASSAQSFGHGAAPAPVATPAPVPVVAPLPAAGWYAHPDGSRRPDGSPRQMYWDGTDWRLDLVE